MMPSLYETQNHGERNLIRPGYMGDGESSQPLPGKTSRYFHALCYETMFKLNYMTYLDRRCDIELCTTSLLKTVKNTAPVLRVKDAQMERCKP